MDDSSGSHYCKILGATIAQARTVPISSEMYLPWLLSRVSEDIDCVSMVIAEASTDECPIRPLDNSAFSSAVLRKIIGRLGTLG
ncbi:hypothetical protein ACFUOZ_09095 [Paenarthrobacter sp. NPDC057355]|uniref:hypothetical protein n=1 Tax=Paenarthrobacter sp. NPDC057355 TaxID=3346105 RepID=UPI003630FDD9